MKTITKTEKKKKEKITPNRILGIYNQEKKGPTIICICSIHGNEPAGRIAFERVLKNLKMLKPDFKGKLLGLWGNITASEKGIRYVDRDLNRLWTEDRINLLEKRGTLNGLNAEDSEQLQLWKLIHEELSQNPRLIFIDLHTTSSESQPFISINDTLKNRYFAIKYPLPIVLGIEEYLDGTILNYINETGNIAIGVEAGQHDDVSSIENHESAIWSTLHFAGCINMHEIPEAGHFVDRLSKDMMDERRVFEVRYRHAIEEHHNFHMKPHYLNFQKVNRKEILAKQDGKEVTAPEKGRIFMPLYQKQGNDGFFIIREIKKFWLKVSTVLRRMKFHRFIQLLPGVGKYKEMDHTITVNTKVARWYVIELFHLLGFRRKIRNKNRMVFIRRTYDL